jgi:hypothetical protein
MVTACASLPPVTSTDPQFAARDSAEKADRELQKKVPPKCYGYVLLVENGHSQPLDIYEVGNQSPRFVAVALIGITEVPMTDRTQQFVAMSSGEIMAASSSNMERPSDRVALQRSCRLFQ